MQSAYGLQHNSETVPHYIYDPKPMPNDVQTISSTRTFRKHCKPTANVRFDFAFFISSVIRETFM